MPEKHFNSINKKLKTPSPGIGRPEWKVWRCHHFHSASCRDYTVQVSTFQSTIISLAPNKRWSAFITQSSKLLEVEPGWGKAEEKAQASYCPSLLHGSYSSL